MAECGDVTSEKTVTKGIVALVRIPLRNLRDYISDGQVCGSSINPVKTAKELEDDGLSGVLYYAITDDMKRKGETLKSQGNFPLNDKYFKTEDGPGYAFIFVEH